MGFRSENKREDGFTASTFFKANKFVSDNRELGKHGDAGHKGELWLSSKVLKKSNFLKHLKPSYQLLGAGEEECSTSYKKYLRT